MLLLWNCSWKRNYPFHTLHTQWGERPACLASSYTACALSYVSVTLPVTSPFSSTAGGWSRALPPAASLEEEKPLAPLLPCGSWGLGTMAGQPDMRGLGRSESTSLDAVCSASVPPVSKYLHGLFLRDRWIYVSNVPERWRKPLNPMNWVTDDVSLSLRWGRLCTPRRRELESTQLGRELCLREHIHWQAGLLCCEGSGGRAFCHTNVRPSPGRQGARTGATQPPWSSREKQLRVWERTVSYVQAPGKPGRVEEPQQHLVLARHLSLG